MWSLIDMTDEVELALEWDRLREDRNALLRRVDKYQGVLIYNSLTDSQKAELATYRQALLDLPTQETPTLAYNNIPTRPSWMA